MREGLMSPREMRGRYHFASLDDASAVRTALLGFEWWPGTGLNRGRRPFQGVNNLYFNYLEAFVGRPNTTKYL